MNKQLQMKKKSSCVLVHFIVVLPTFCRFYQNIIQGQSTHTVFFETYIETTMKWTQDDFFFHLQLFIHNNLMSK